MIKKMNFSFCRCCGSRIDQDKYRNALFCSEACRKTHWDIAHKRSTQKSKGNGFEAVGKLPVISISIDKPVKEDATVNIKGDSSKTNTDG